MASTNEVEELRRQLSIARNEIKNLRSELNKLNQVHRKEIEQIKSALNQPTNSSQETITSNNQMDTTEPIADELIKFRPIGVIRTIFPEKRCLPRQAILGSNFLSKMEFLPSVFTNPEHSLEGLDDFSHIWIIYHFHKNSSHPKAKVAPPRLDGKRIGVFSSRSPHRPCPIGLSLVELDHIQDNCIYFKGTDMVDGTPVLDIKPYIPHYDNPQIVYEQNLNETFNDNSFLDGGPREAPDGEENISESTPSQQTTLQHSSPTVKVPTWVLSGTKLNVDLTENALQQSLELGVDVQALKNVLKSDPRSVYLRTRYGSEVYTFQLGDNTVSVQFDDNLAQALVLQIRKTVSTEELGDAQ